MFKLKKIKFFENFLKDISPKASFALGLFFGVAVFSTVSFVLLYSAFSKAVEGQASVDMALQGQELVADDQAADAYPEEAKQQDDSEKIDISKLSPINREDHVKGNFDAPVTLLLFTDFQCPYCARHGDTINQIAEAYKDEVRVVLRHFPLGFHDQAQKAAEATECASEQGKFWEMHDKVFGLNKQGAMSVENFKKAAAELGLKAEQFDACLDSGKYADKVKADYQEGIAVGIGGTPTTIVNGKLVAGALPFEQFSQIIESELQ